LPRSPSADPEEPAVGASHPPGPDAHRAASRPGRSPSTGTFDESGLQALGDQIRSTHRGRRGRHRKTRWILGTLAVVIVLVVGGTAGYAWYLNHEIHRIDVKGLTDVPTSGADAGTENILMVGSTDRCALKVQNAAYGLCSAGVNGVNSDVVMILHLDPNKHSVSILSIPRDLFVPNARTSGANKIDAALYQGPSQLVAAINEDFGIPIQHYVVLNFDSFANVVDALGGVKMYFPEPVYDAYSGLKQLTPGCVQLDGFEALQVVRARHLQYKGPGITTDLPEFWPSENLSDLARIRRDHEFLRVLASAVAKQGLSNPLTDEQLVSGLAPQLEVDRKFSTSDMVDLVLNFHSVNVNSAPQLTLPVEVDQSNAGYTYQGGAYGDVEFPSIAQDQAVIDKFLGIDASIDSMTGKVLPSPPAVSVSVLNGTGTYNQAADTSAALQSLGFHIAGIGDTPSVGTESETVVYYAIKSPADQAAAEAVARSLSGSVITALGPTTDGAQVTVVTGTQFSVNPPPAAPVAGSPSTSAASGGTTTSPPSTTTTTSASGSSGSSFLPPTAAVTPLQPWDPRSCSAQGGAGS
jgi:LCP family protein required for cell wall assembly